MKPKNQTFIVTATLFYGTISAILCAAVLRVQSPQGSTPLPTEAPKVAPQKSQPVQQDTDLLTTDVLDTPNLAVNSPQKKDEEYNLSHISPTWIEWLQKQVAIEIEENTKKFAQK